MNNLKPEEEALVRTIATEIIALEQHPGWKHFVKAAETLADSSIPNISSFTETEEASIASKVVFASGIRRCLGIVKHQKDILSSLNKQQH